MQLTVEYVFNKLNLFSKTFSYLLLKEISLYSENLLSFFAKCFKFLPNFMARLHYSNLCFQCHIKDMIHPTLAKKPIQILLFLAKLLPLSGLPSHPNPASNSQNTCTIHALIQLCSRSWIEFTLILVFLTENLQAQFFIHFYLLTKNYNLKLGSECNSILIFGDEGHFFLLLSILQIRK